jgi:hypothetical protein
MKKVYEVRVVACGKAGLTEVKLETVEDWDSLKNLLCSLLISLKGDGLESVIITPLEIGAEKPEQA